MSLHFWEANSLFLVARLHLINASLQLVTASLHLVTANSQRITARSHVVTVSSQLQEAYLGGIKQMVKTVKAAQSAT